MDGNLTENVTQLDNMLTGPDDLSLRRWFGVYAAYLLALAIPLAILLAGVNHGPLYFVRHLSEYTALGDEVLKLLIFALYVSLAMTFVPLPTGWIVAAVAMADVALAPNVWLTTLLVATIGAVGSTFANLTDYHVFTWMLRHHKIAAVRHVRLYDRSARWFGRQPFMLVLIFSFLPIPVDVIRMLAASTRYPLRPFALANFLGRFVRYAVIAFITFELGPKGWVSVLILLGLAVVLALAKGVSHLAQRPAAGT
jgi:membrane protein YqaA with SNARE-associated domain